MVKRTTVNMSDEDERAVVAIQEHFERQGIKLTEAGAIRHALHEVARIYSSGTSKRRRQED